MADGRILKFSDDFINDIKNGRITCRCCTVVFISLFTVVVVISIGVAFVILATLWIPVVLFAMGLLILFCLVVGAIIYFCLRRSNFAKRSSRHARRRSDVPEGMEEIQVDLDTATSDQSIRSATQTDPLFSETSTLASTSSECRFQSSTDKIKGISKSSEPLSPETMVRCRRKRQTKEITRPTSAPDWLMTTPLQVPDCITEAPTSGQIPDDVPRDLTDREIRRTLSAPNDECEGKIEIEESETGE